MTGRESRWLGQWFWVSRLLVPNLISYRHPSPRLESSCRHCHHRQLTLRANAQRAFAMQPKGGRTAASLGSRSATRHEPGTGSVVRASLADTRPSSPLVTGPRWGPIRGGDAYPKEAAIASTLGLHDGGPLDHHADLQGASWTMSTEQLWQMDDGNERWIDDESLSMDRTLALNLTSSCAQPDFVSSHLTSPCVVMLALPSPPTSRL